MPPELNKKNGRPKVLTSAQELEVRDWLRKPENRTRYLDDLVWLIHDRFGIVCSTTTMSKMKRKWLRVFEYEETGRPLDAVTRESLLETHPELPILQDGNAMPTDEGDGGDVVGGVDGVLGMPPSPLGMENPMGPPGVPMMQMPLNPLLRDGPGPPMQGHVPITPYPDAMLQR